MCTVMCLCDFICVRKNRLWWYSLRLRWPHRHTLGIYWKWLHLLYVIYKYGHRCDCMTLQLQLNSIEIKLAKKFDLKETILSLISNCDHKHIYTLTHYYFRQIIIIQCSRPSLESSRAKCTHIQMLAKKNCEEEEEEEKDKTVKKKNQWIRGGIILCLSCLRRWFIPGV